MSGSSLLALIDDIATILDDVALMTRVAAKKTAGVLGDDLALNAEQVSGVKAERELPVVWAVAKGSFKNKLILVPAALALSAFLPFLITPLLMIGGAYLCFEGFEKIAHKFMHSASDDQNNHDEMLKALSDDNIDMVEFEQNKIKGAIRTDFILSAEIIVIALGSVGDADFTAQALTVSIIALAMTVGVYGLVAGIVKLDDAGFYLIKDTAKSIWAGFKRGLGRALLSFAPKLMKTLSVVGTAAMFMVGGDILLHGIPGSHDIVHTAEHFVQGIPGVGSALAVITPTLLGALFGVIAGALVLLAVTATGAVFGKKQPSETDDKK